jgi:hypothetical protein
MLKSCSCISHKIFKIENKKGFKMTKKEIIKELMVGYGRKYISVKEDLEGVFVDTFKKDGVEITYSLEHNETLGIKDVITGDNIHLYYELMSKSERNKISNILDGIFKIRLNTIKNLLDINVPILDDNFTYEMNKNNQVSMTLFGTKDTLKPLEEYIKDIKESEQYKEYVSKKVA